MKLKRSRKERELDPADDKENSLKRRVCYPLAATVLIFTLAVAANSETWRGRQLEQEWRLAPWRFGPFRLQPRIIIANAGIDSNIYYSPDSPVKDFTLTAGPALKVFLPASRKLVFSVSGSPNYVYYVKTARERTWNYYLSGSAAINLRRLFFSLESRFSDARERWNTEIDIRPRRKENGLASQLLIQISRRTSFELGFRNARYDYEYMQYESFNVAERLNRRENYFDLLGYYQVTSRTRFFLDYEYGKYDFIFSEASSLKDSRSRALFSGFEFLPAGRIRGRLRLGYKKLDVINPEIEDFQGLVGDAQLSFRLAKPLVWRVSYTRNSEFSLWYRSAYYVFHRPSTGMSFYIFRLIRLDYDYSFGRSNYPSPQDISPGQEVKRRDDFFVHQAGVYVRLRKNVALGVVVNRWIRDSNIDREDDKRYFYGLNLTYEF